MSDLYHHRKPYLVQLAERTLVYHKNGIYTIILNLLKDTLYNIETSSRNNILNQGKSIKMKHSEKLNLPNMSGDGWETLNAPDGYDV